MRRAVVLLPNGFTLFNLFCGIYAIVLASRTEFSSAAWFVLLGGVADALDGRVARATGTGSRFGEELDSLVDAISFGFAPAMIMYYAVLNRGNWDWIFVFFFTACAVLRLARFNVEQAGRKKTHFHGLPSPAAGITLATYYWFSQTPLYNETVILFTNHTTLADLQWHNIMRFVMLGIAGLMISNVPYPALPNIGFRGWRQWLSTVIVIGGILAFILIPREFVFPMLVVYIAFGALKSVLLGLFGVEGEPEAAYWGPDTDDDDGAMITAAGPTFSSRRDTPGATRLTPAPGVAALEAQASRRKRRRRRPNRGDRPEGGPPRGPNSNPPREGSNE